MSRVAALLMRPAMAGAVLLLQGTVGYAQSRPPKPHKPLHLAEQGTFYVGGSIEFRTPNSSTNISDPRSLPGNIAVDQV